MKRNLAALLALCMLLLAGCAKTNTPQTPDTPSEPDVPVLAPADDPAPAEDESVKVYTVGGLDVPVDKEYLDLLLIQSELESWSEHWTPLISLSEKASVEAQKLDQPEEEWGAGWLCSIMRLDRIGFEEWISGDDTGSYLFARDDADGYYLLLHPTDVRLYRPEDAPATEADVAQWTALNEWAETLPDAIIARNGLTSYSARDLLGVDYTYDGEHVDLGYRFPGKPLDLVVLSVSQPARQGEGGIWCVERVRSVYSDYDWTDTHLVFPAALGIDMTAADYYAQVQRECDAGGHPELLTPAGAALDYARQTAWLFGEDVSASDFKVVETLG